jgi:hypothetical protein
MHSLTSIVHFFYPFDAVRVIQSVITRVICMRGAGFKICLKSILNISRVDAAALNDNFEMRKFDWILTLLTLLVSCARAFFTPFQFPVMFSIIKKG